jgi:hypothetical protein
MISDNQPAIDKIRCLGLGARTATDRVIFKATSKTLPTTMTVAKDISMSNELYGSISTIYPYYHTIFRGCHMLVAL